MLERAAGCLENAGRRFFRESNGAVRSSRTIYPQFRRQFNDANTDSPQWFMTFVQAADIRASQTLKITPNRSRTTKDTWTPSLDFLYPRQARELAASCLLRSSKRIVPRRRKKQLHNFARTYASQATSSSSQDAEAGTLEPSAGEDWYDWDDPEDAKTALIELLSGKGKHYDKAWAFYVAAGHPLELNARLLAFLHKSRKLEHHDLAKRLFAGIPVGCRSVEDYLHLGKSYLACGKPLEMGISEEAIANNRGIPCWSLTLAHLLNTEDWTAVQKVWDMRQQSWQNEWLRHLFLHLRVPRVFSNMQKLATFLQSQEQDSSLRELARSLLEHILSSVSIVERITTETLLSILRMYKDLDILAAGHYYTLINTLQSSDMRSTLVRSLVFYRNFRWQMEQEIPPAKLLGKVLQSFASFEITNGVQYLLDEFAHFYGKPSIDAYKSALVSFSRAGDAEKVHSVFDRLVADHGNPKSRRLVTPLLYVHARVGNVQETKRQFQRISDEFGLKQNTVCWNNLLTAHANTGDFDESFATFEQMIKEGVEPNAHTFGTLMGVCAKRGDIDTVRLLLALTKQWKVETTTPLLDTVVQSYCNIQRFDLAESIAETCLDLGVKGSRVRMWNVLLWNYAFRLDLESVSRIRNRMDDVGLQPDGMTYGALMLSLVLIGQTDSARRVLRTLHRSHRVHPTEFHYAVVLYGYVKAQNRDMIQIVSREIQKRFTRLGPSSSLLVLKSKTRRDLELIKEGDEVITGVDMHLENGEKFLADTLADFDTMQLATKSPVPGAGKWPLSETFPAIYYENLITAYGSGGASEQVQKLIDQFIGGRQKVAASHEVDDNVPLRMLSAMMFAHLNAEQFKKVDECWRMVFSRGIQMATRPSIDQRISNVLPPSNKVKPTNASPRNIATTKSGRNSSLLPSLRFSLSRPLSLHMRSLAYRLQFDKVRQVMKKVEQTGFSLTTFNWITYVQVLSQSDKPSDQVEAFTVFEDKFMPNFVGWKHLQRGYGARPADVPPIIDLLEPHTRNKHPSLLGKEGRRYWSKIEPQFMQPTYLSMVYLGAALNTFRARSMYDGGAELKALYDAAPLTVRAVAEMPYLPDKFQGVLLRQRTRRNEADPKSPTGGRNNFVWTGGVLGLGGKPRPVTDSESSTPKRDRRNAAAAEGQSEVPHDAEHKETGEPHDDEQPIAAVTDEHLKDIAAWSDMTLDHQDQHDIELESHLKRRRRLRLPTTDRADSWNRGLNTKRYQWLFGKFARKPLRIPRASARKPVSPSTEGKSELEHSKKK